MRAARNRLVLRTALHVACAAYPDGAARAVQYAPLSYPLGVLRVSFKPTWPPDVQEEVQHTAYCEDREQYIM